MLDKILGEIQYIHQDLSRMVEDYQDTVDRARDRGRIDAETLNFLRNLPGAKYRVMSEYIRQQWLVLDGEVMRRFPKTSEREASDEDGGAAGLEPLGRF
jgi:hypothetical protein